VRGIWRRASDRPRWIVEATIGLLMLPLSIVPIWAYMERTDDGFLMYLRGRYAIAAPSTPKLDEAAARLASAELSNRVRGVPVLVYHGLGRTTGERVDDRYIVSRKHFAEHMHVLRLAGFEPITTRTLARYLATGSPRLLPRKPVVITFDDGRADAMIQADPILRDTGMKATMFVIGEAANGVSFYYESWRDLRSYAESGRWELANHTYGLHHSHDDIKGLPAVSGLVHPEPDESLASFEARVGADIARNQAMLRGRGGSRTAAFSYPYGDWGRHARRDGVAAAVQRALRKHVDIAFDQDEQSGWRFALPQDDLMHVHRLEVQDQSGARFLARLRAAERLTDAAFGERGLDVPYRPRALAAAARRTTCPTARAAPLSSRPSAGRVVALTFDGGPSVYTAQVLDVLGRHGARATFFVTGANIAGHERLLWKIVLGGSEIGNATWSHAHPSTLGGAALGAELERTSTAVEAAARVRPCFSRPPYREEVARHVRESARRGMATALWSVDPRDHTLRSPAALARRVLEDVRPGAVITLHDDSGSSRWVTVQALGRILQGLERRGYTTVTLSHLWRGA
jgi:peptidoglycan/xylan/chitin deacetylase (PgdA/CDA1 family)